MNSRKKEFGQFFTDPLIAQFMVDLCVDQHTSSLLDPAVGMGIFTKLAYQKKDTIHITACEIDPCMIGAFKENNPYPSSLIEKDYLMTDFAEKYDCIICNPPYHKFQAIPDRKEYISLFQEKYGVTINGYSNICVYFLVKSMNELNRGGKCCYIIPYEFLNTGYGEIIKQYLLSSKMLKQVIKFDSHLSLFTEAITTSCIIFLENNAQSQVEFITIDDIEELKSKSFTKRRTYHYSDLNSKDKWLKYFELKEENAASGYRNLVKVSAFGKVSRGIATGNNDYFVLNASMISQKQLSRQVCMPCLTKAPDIKDIVFTTESFERLSKEDKKVYLFDGIQANSEEDRAYIHYGEETGVNRAFLTSHRKPWYAIEEKKAAPILISAFSREKIKIIRNESGIKNLTTFHGFHLLNEDNEWANMMFCYLITPIAQKLLLRSRREYGGGLKKFEPNDLNRAEMLNLTIISETDRHRIMDIYAQIKRENELVGLEQLEEIFKSYLLKR